MLGGIVKTIKIPSLKNIYPLLYTFNIAYYYGGLCYPNPF